MLTRKPYNTFFWSPCVIRISTSGPKFNDTRFRVLMWPYYFYVRPKKTCVTFTWMPCVDFIYHFYVTYVFFHHVCPKLQWHVILYSLGVQKNAPHVFCMTWHIFCMTWTLFSALTPQFHFQCHCSFNFTYEPAFAACALTHRLRLSRMTDSVHYFAFAYALTHFH